MAPTVPLKTCSMWIKLKLNGSVLPINTEDWKYFSSTTHKIGLIFSRKFCLVNFYMTISTSIERQCAMVRRGSVMSWDLFVCAKWCARSSCRRTRPLWRCAEDVKCRHRSALMVTMCSFGILSSRYRLPVPLFLCPTCDLRRVQKIWANMRTPRLLEGDLFEKTIYKDNWWVGKNDYWFQAIFFFRVSCE